VRRIFDLHPRNPESSGRTIGLLARSGGTLVGAIVDARFDPFELLDERGEVVARGGEVVTVGGAHMVKEADPRRLGHESAFSAWQLSRSEPTNP
jgi:hypothetical protein